MRGRIVLIIAFVAVALCGCNVLGPRYEVRRQVIELRYEPAAAGQPIASARVSYELRNTGNTQLTSLAATMPPNLDAGAARLITPEAARRELPVREPWHPKKTHTTAIEYSFVVPRAGDDSLFIADANWLPQLLPPDAVMASGGSPPQKLEMYVTLPADFRVAAPGRYRGAKPEGGLRRHRFEITSADLPPYIIAGRYQEQIIDRSGVRLHLWTAQPMERSETERVSVEMGMAVAKYVEQLGALPDKRTHLWLVDAHGGTASETFVFPGGVVFYPPLFDSERVNAAGMCRASRWLAGVWFEAVMKPRDEARDLAEALALFMAAGVEPQCRASESAPASGASLEREKAQLFVAALERRIGAPALRAALKRMVQALAGGRWGLADLRAAAEGEAKQDLADFFRVWNTPGIPQELRTQQSEAKE